MKTILGAITLALSLYGTAGAAPPSGAEGSADDKLILPLEGKITNPDWRTEPDAAQMQREYPPVAAAMNLPGTARITCSVEVTGQLDECRVDDDSPPGLGFGAAALDLSDYFLMKPATLDGQAVKGRVTIPLQFQLAGYKAETAAPKLIPPPTSPQALSVAREVVALRGDADQLHQFAGAITDRLTMNVVAGGDAVAGERIADAYRLAVGDVTGKEMDARARMLAASMTAAQLEATLAYLQSPAGVAYRTAQKTIDDPTRVNLWMEIAEAAKTHLCEHTACPGEVADVH